MITVYSAEAMGRRNKMQDATAINIDLDQEVGIVGVFDGHGLGGEQVAQELSDAIAHIPLDGLYEGNNEPAVKLVKKILQEVHIASSSRRAGSPEQEGGSTALVTVLGNAALTPLWVGDGFMGFYPDNSEAKKFVVAHDGTNESEMDRVLGMGGNVWIDERVKSTTLYRFGTGMMLSRSIGHGEDMPFMSAEPDITEVKRSNGMLILATDGIVSPIQFWSQWLVTDDGIASLRREAPIEEPIPLSNSYVSQETANYLANTGSEITGDNGSLVIVGLRPN